MRALFTVQPSVGHLHPLVPVARALSQAGHGVVVCSAPSFRPQVEAFGLPYLDAGLDWSMSDQSTWEVFPAMPPPGPAFPAWAVLTLADITTQRMVPDLLAITSEWKPDLVIREGMEYGGCIAAEALESRTRRSPATPTPQSTPPRSTTSRATAGWSPSRWPATESRSGCRRIPRSRCRSGTCTCASRRRPGTGSVPRPRNARFLRHISTVAPGAHLPDWVERLPDQPTVLASLGTVFNKTPGVLEAIVAALAEEPVNLIVAIGRDQDPSRFGPQPDHVRLEAHVPQALLLARCDAFVTHGGFNSVKEALSSGVPMVVLPITADQPYSAERCADLGLARTLGPDARVPDAIRDAVWEVLTEPSYRANARAFKEEMMALPGPEAMVDLLESLPAQARQDASGG